MLSTVYAGTLTLPIVNAVPTQSFVVKNISGLSGSDVNLFLGDYSRDGGYYQGRRAGQRNIVFDLKMNPTWDTVSGIKDGGSLRDILERAFYGPSSYANIIPSYYNSGENFGVLLQFVDDIRGTRSIYGHCERIETDMFVKESDMYAQVSMICPFPYLAGNTTTGNIPSAPVSEINLPYLGTVENGLEFQLEIKAECSKATAQMGSQLMTFRPPTGSTFKAGETLRVNTVLGKRSIYYKNLFDQSILDVTSPFIALGGSTNTLVVGGDASRDGKAVLTYYTFTNLYRSI